MSDHIFSYLLKEYFSEGTEAYLQQVSNNCIVFGYDHPHLKVLAQNIPLDGTESWVIPGGFIRNEEQLEEAAQRNLKLSGIEDVFLRQVGAFSGLLKMFDRKSIDKIIDEDQNSIVEWISNRFVQVVFYGIVDLRNTVIPSENLALKTEWLKISELNKLVPSHAHIVAETKRKLITELLDYPVILSFFPDTFTLNELRGLYEAILDRPIDRGTFRRKLLSLNILEKIDEKTKERGRPSYLYRFNKEKYLANLNERVRFGF